MELRLRGLSMLKLLFRIFSDCTNLPLLDIFCRQSCLFFRVAHRRAADPR
jgi:hypothetical protein